ncbi:hypothetical protein GCM10011418_36880 [Sphingobacterium alkalisoli]|uniref:hypothetical protein n=1 Tax=Sphingobacterium alkalisoli TaxID=1874115 RepID=UPI0019BC2F60|nr:hypothetical protein [Sphingobacterium alkalisoli]GGH27133.1 hypothetical protein GCM10011418_36880 [Sphingobacterium alkalisoli]
MILSTTIKVSLLNRVIGSSEANTSNGIKTADILLKCFIIDRKGEYVVRLLACFRKNGIRMDIKTIPIRIENKITNRFQAQDGIFKESCARFVVISTIFSYLINPYKGKVFLLFYNFRFEIMGFTRCII